MAIVEIDPFVFSRGHLAFEMKVPVQLDAGEVLCITGESGAHVSDFLHMIFGLDDVKRVTSAAAGRTLVRLPLPPQYSNPHAVRICGIAVRTMDDIARANAIAIVLDNPELSILGSTVAEEFRYSAAALGKPTWEHPSIHLLEAYGLHEKLERKTNVLSGGERHRLAIACAMERDVRVLVLDLTRSNLDPEFEEWVLRRIDSWLELRASSGGGVVIVAGIESGRLQQAVKVKLRTVVLTSGGTSEFGTAPSTLAIQLPKLQRDAAKGPEVLRTERLGRLHYGRRQSFVLRAGEIACFHGPNGCGKTSIALALSGRESPHHFAGRFVLQPGIVPSLAVQHAERSFLGMTVLEELGNKDIAAKLGLTDADLALHPRGLPYAKQKLVSTAVAMAVARGVVILDEPTCGMDDMSRVKFMDLINGAPGLAFIIFTHDPALQSLFTSRELGT